MGLHHTRHMVSRQKVKVVVVVGNSRRSSTSPGMERAGSNNPPGKEDGDSRSSW